MQGSINSDELVGQNLLGIGLLDDWKDSGGEL